MRHYIDRRQALQAMCLAVVCWAVASPMASVSGDSNGNLGPYNVGILEGGVGLTRPLADGSRLLAAGAPWSLSGWLSVAHRTPGPAVIAAIGNGSGSVWRGLELQDGKLIERKAQLMDYVSYRAIFEGFQAHLRTKNSGRLLWMTHPSWPSNTWQIYSADYDTAVAY